MEQQVRVVSANNRQRDGEASIRSPEEQDRSRHHLAHRGGLELSTGTGLYGACRSTQCCLAVWSRWVESITRLGARTWLCHRTPRACLPVGPPPRDPAFRRPPLRMDLVSSFLFFYYLDLSSSSSLLFSFSFLVFSFLAFSFLVLSFLFSSFLFLLFFVFSCFFVRTGVKPVDGGRRGDVVLA